MRDMSSIGALEELHREPRWGQPGPGTKEGPSTVPVLHSTGVCLCTTRFQWGEEQEWWSTRRPQSPRGPGQPGDVGWTKPPPNIVCHTTASAVGLLIAHHTPRPDPQEPRSGTGSCAGRCQVSVPNKIQMQLHRVQGFETTHCRPVDTSLTHARTSLRVSYSCTRRLPTPVYTLLSFSHGRRSWGAVKNMCGYWGDPRTSRHPLGSDGS